VSSDLKIDEIGYWSEVKLSILEEYAKPYNQILRSHNLHPNYVDGFAGAGRHKAKGSERVIDGSPTRALNVDPPFDSFYFVDSDEGRVSELQRLSAGRTNVHVHHGDCNKVLISEVFPKISYANRQRALCILDPYGLDLDWQVIQVAGKSKVTEIFLNFPVMDMNRNVFWRNYDRVSSSNQERMTRFWGDDSWKDAAYTTTQGLFEEMQEKNPIDDVVEAFRSRLKKTAGFQHVPSPMPMRNSKGAVVYFLFFAAQQPAADKIVKDIFAKYTHYGEIPNG
jgi:three-Cys-motif partner protein